VISVQPKEGDITRSRQYMQVLNQSSALSSVKWCSFPPHWLGEPPIAESNTWVHLLTEFSDFAGDEALLLCQESDSDWVAWIPNYGEARLDVGQFCINP
jgi:hypothetical protein